MPIDAKALAGGMCLERPPRLPDDQVNQAVAQLPGWARAGAEIRRTYSFKDYYQTMAFVNAVAYIAHGQNHHPDLEVGYNRCEVRFSTHSAGGISINDLICAARVSALAG